MRFDPLWLFLTLFPSGIGFVLFVYGRKQERLPQLAAGILLIAYPYFISTVTALVVVGAIICAGCWWAVRAGW